jgi:hypothetical protein
MHAAMRQTEPSRNPRHPPEPAIRTRSGRSAASEPMTLYKFFIIQMADEYMYLQSRIEDLYLNESEQAHDEIEILYEKYARVRERLIEMQPVALLENIQSLLEGKNREFYENLILEIQEEVRDRKKDLNEY